MLPTFGYAIFSLVPHPLIGEDVRSPLFVVLDGKVVRVDDWVVRAVVLG
jgi:hypothetical protein